LNRLLIELFGALDAADVEYCLLRGADELEAPRSLQEIDLLVRPSCLPDFAQAAARLGFVAWPEWGHEPHRFFLAFDPEQGSWIKLDVVTRLVYGRPVRCLELDWGEESWSKRRPWGRTWLLAPEDEFLTLMLHGILDKGRFRASQWARLRELWQEIQAEPVRHLRFLYSLDRHVGTQVRTTIESALPGEGFAPGWGWRARLAARLLRRQPFAAAGRLVHTWVRRRLRRVLFVLHRHGTSTVLLAPDGGGKSTLAAALAGDPWLRARVVYMGGNAKAGGFRLPATAWLERRLRAARSRRFAPERPLLRAAGSLNHLTEDLLRYALGEVSKLQGRFVVYDRYFYDTYLSARAQARRVRLRRWVIGLTCPDPDLVLLLDAPGQVLWNRKHEHTPEFLEKQRQILLGLADRLQNLEVIDATRTAEEVRRQAVAAIWEEFARRS
jgi:thymidylate kinase